MTRHKRRNFFIKKDFQGRLILGYFLFAAGGCLLLLFLLALFSADTLTISYVNNDLQLGQTPIMLLKETLAANWFFIVIGSIFLVIAAMLITHRIAGPMFRFEKTLDNMLNGRLDDEIHLRSKDEGKELADKLNTFNRELSGTLKKVRYRTEEIEKLVDQLQQRTNTNDQEQSCSAEPLQETVDKLALHTKEIKSHCSLFTVKNE